MIKTWQGSPQSPVILDDVERHLYTIGQKFNRLQAIRYDPYQAVSIAQRLTERGLPMEQFNFSPNNITRLTQNLFELFKNGRIRLFEYDALVNELLTVKIVEKAYGFRIDHANGQHDDHVISLGLSALAAVEAPAHTLATKWAVVRTIGPVNSGACSIEIQDFHPRYKFALEQHNGQSRIRAICPRIVDGDAKTIFTEKHFNSRESFRAYLTAQHGAIRFINHFGA